MLALPSGQVLVANEAGSVEIYTPPGFSDPAWQPAISSVTNNGDGTYTLTGTKLNGISEGAFYGDDNYMSSNYPIVKLVNVSGKVYYAQTADWSSTGVSMGDSTSGVASESTLFSLPAGLPLGQYSLYVTANGIASAPVSFSNAPATTTALTATATAANYGQSITFTATVSADGSSLSPTGSLQFVIDGVNYGSSVKLLGATASITDTSLGAGTHTIAAIYTNTDGQFLDSNGALTGGVTILKDHLTVTASSLSMSYGNVVPTLDDTITGFVNGENAGVVSGDPVLFAAATATSNVGSYTITVSQGTLSAANYDFPSFVDGTLTINRAHLTVAADSQSMTYGGQVPILTYTISGYVNGDNSHVVTGMPVLTTAATSASPAGVSDHCEPGKPGGDELRLR